jgi:hypothetical protein
MLAFQGAGSPLRPSVTPSTAAIHIWKSNALAAKLTKRWRSTSFASRKPLPSVSLSDTCAEGLFATERAPIQTQPPGRAEVDENIRVQSAVNMVAGRALIPT